LTDAHAGGSIWLYSDDQIFSDRIATTAASRSIPYRRLTEAELAGLPSHRGLLLLDLDKGAASLARAIAFARSAGQDAWHVCGYGSHVDAEGLRVLRELGADRVTTKSRLLQTLELIITESVAG
jgi:hypothetical protein